MYAYSHGGVKKQSFYEAKLNVLASAFSEFYVQTERLASGSHSIATHIRDAAHTSLYECQHSIAHPIPIGPVYNLHAWVFWHLTYSMKKTL